MPLSDQYTRLQLRTMVRTELLDPSARFWPDAELNDYLEKWQATLQSDFEFVWGTATTTVSSGTSTLTLTAVATDIMRLDAIWWNGTRLPARSKEELDTLKRDWRLDTPYSPLAVYQDNFDTVSLWPAPSTTGTAVFEYPKALTFGGSDLTAMALPAWTRYSAKNFACYHALLRTGPNQDKDRALRRKKKFQTEMLRYQTTMDNFFPDKALTLRPSGRYEARILNPRCPSRYR